MAETTATPPAKVTTVTVKPSSTAPVWHIHFVYIAAFLIIAALTYYGGRVLWSEHEQRIQAQAVVKAQQTAIEGLQKQMAQNDAQTAATIASLQKTVANVKTPAQVIQVLPQILPAPLPAPPVLNPDNSVTFSAPDVLALFSDLSQGKEAEVALVGCQKDLATQTQIVADQKLEIAALKAKPRFWVRVKSDMKKVGIGVAIGAALVILK